MKTILLLFSILCLCYSSIPGDGIEGCTGNENTFDLVDKEPTLVAQVAHGKKFTVGKTLIIQTMMEEISILGHLRAMLLRWERLMDNYLNQNLKKCKNNFINGHQILSLIT